MEFEQLLRLVDAVSRSSLTDFKYEESGVKLRFSKEETMVTSAACKEEADSALETAAGTKETVMENKTGTEVTSPLVGIFYAAPSEDAEPFVRVGDAVKKGQTLAIVEAMKLMNEIACECDGTVEEVLAENGRAVEYGQPLFRIG